jgi:hypothetical protein
MVSGCPDRDLTRLEGDQVSIVLERDPLHNPHQGPLSRSQIEGLFSLPVQADAFLQGPTCSRTEGPAQSRAFRPEPTGGTGVGMTQAKSSP